MKEIRGVETRSGSNRCGTATLELVKFEEEKDSLLKQNMSASYALMPNRTKHKTVLHLCILDFHEDEKRVNKRIAVVVYRTLQTALSHTYCKHIINTGIHIKITVFFVIFCCVRYKNYSSREMYKCIMLPAFNNGIFNKAINIYNKHKAAGCSKTLNICIASNYSFPSDHVSLD